MDKAQIMSIIVQLFGGLGLFLYGMNVMSDGLEKSAGDKMKKIIEVLTKNKIMAVVVGAIVTMIVQSSSATTVMVVGFVNAGIMSLTQAIGIIMGANIGTTVTAQLVALDLVAIAPVAIGVGVLFKLFSKNESTKKYADILIGFGILFLGMDFMKDAVKPLREFEGFTNLILSFGSGNITDTLFGFLTGFIVTAIIQSSSATTGILVALASTGLLPIEAAFPILMGTNVGTCVTALISSVGANKTAKRAALMHLLFNVVGTALFVVLFSSLTIDFVLKSSSLAQKQLANAHTIFNIANTLLLLPFAGIIVRIVEKLIPITEDEKVTPTGTKYLDERILETPSIAIGQVMREVMHMGNVAKKSFANSRIAFLDKDLEKAQKTFKLEKIINGLEEEIIKYLMKLSNRAEISRAQRIVLDGLFSTINDIERVGDHADNLAELAIYRIDNNLEMSETALEELNHMFDRVEKSYNQALDSLANYDSKLAQNILQREGEIDNLEKSLRKKHIKRLNNNQCQPASGIVFLDTISNLERIADHASNIASAVIDNSESE
jgi:phosphate:Na+ symporter